MTREVLLQINYPGDCISVNHYLGKRKGGGYYVKPETKAWKEEFQWLLKKCHLEEFRLPLEITCSGWFKNERSAPDVHNLLKVIADSIQELTGINDKNYLMYAGERNIIGNKELPYLLITIREATPSVKMARNGVFQGASGTEGVGVVELPKQKKKGLK